MDLLKEGLVARFEQSKVVPQMKGLWVSNPGTCAPWIILTHIFVSVSLQIEARLLMCGTIVSVSDFSWLK